MTVLDTLADARPRPPLGVGALLGATGALLKNNLPRLVGTAILLFCLMHAASFATDLVLARYGVGLMTAGSAAAASPTAANVVATILFGLVAMVLGAAIYCALTAVALGLASERPARASGIARATIRLTPPFFLASLAVVALIGLGLVALAVPGLWVAGVYSVLPAVVVAEDRRWGALRRTARLTREYRWPLVGFVVLLFLVTGVIGFLVGVVNGFVQYGQGAERPARIALSLLLDAVSNGSSAAITSTAAVVAYRRLVEIKEGGGGAELRAVFE